MGRATAEVAALAAALEASEEGGHLERVAVLPVGAVDPRAVRAVAVEQGEELTVAAAAVQEREVGCMEEVLLAMVTTAEEAAARAASVAH